MKYILLIFLSVSTISCITTKNELAGKTFYHTYLYYTAMNEFGKGGGNRHLSLSFTDNSIMLCDIKENSAATESGEHKTTKDTIETYRATYRISSGIITIDSPIIPEVRIEGDTLIAPKININVNGKSDLFNNAHFTPHP